MNPAGATVAPARSVRVVMPGGVDDPAAPSGGNRYDRRVCGELPRAGWPVHEHAVPGTWPDPGPEARAELARILAESADGSVVLLDGLVACAAPDVVVPEAARLRLAVLVHLPLADETGLTPERAAELDAAERRTLHAVSAVIATSTWAATRLITHHDLPPSRVHVAPPGADRAPLSRGSDRSGAAGTTPTPGAAPNPALGTDAGAALSPARRTDRGTTPGTGTDRGTDPGTALGAEAGAAGDAAPDPISGLGTDRNRDPGTDASTVPGPNLGRDTNPTTDLGADAGTHPDLGTDRRTGSGRASTPTTGTNTVPGTDRGTTPGLDTDRNTAPGTDAGAALSPVPDAGTDPGPGTDRSPATGPGPDRSTDPGSGTDRRANPGAPPVTTPGSGRAAPSDATAATAATASNAPSGPAPHADPSARVADTAPAATSDAPSASASATATVTATNADPSAPAPLLLCVATVSPRKGQLRLVDALIEVAAFDWRCVLVGGLGQDPGYVAQVRERIDAAGLGARIRLAGPRVGPALAATYAAADLLVLASHAETYGMAVTEALARGIPVLATAVGGVPEALGRAPDGTLPGVLVPPDDPAALTAALRAWLAEPGERRRSKDAAYQRRTTLAGWDTTARSLAEVLERLPHEPRRTA